MRYNPVNWIKHYIDLYELYQATAWQMHIPALKFPEYRLGRILYNCNADFYSAFHFVVDGDEPHRDTMINFFIKQESLDILQGTYKDEWAADRPTTESLKSKLV